MNTNSKYYDNYYFLFIFHGSWLLVYFLIWLMKHIIIITFCSLFMVLVYFCLFNEAYHNYHFLLIKCIKCINFEHKKRSRLTSIIHSITCLYYHQLMYLVINCKFFVSYHCFCILVFCLVSPSFPIFCYKDNQAKVINSLLFFTKSFFSVKLFISKLNINQFRLGNPVQTSNHGRL